MSKYARHATDLFTILQSALVSNRVIQTLTKSHAKSNRINQCHTEVHVQPTNPDDELTTIVARALVDLEGPVHVPFDKVGRGRAYFDFLSVYGALAQASEV